MKRSEVVSAFVCMTAFLCAVACGSKGEAKVDNSQSKDSTANTDSVLQLGSNEEILSRLDSLERTGGTQAVVQWVEQELRPGRLVSLDSGGRETIEIADRSVWSVDKQGKITNEALLKPITDETFGESEVLAVWTRSQATQPFAVRVRKKLKQ